jgi:hypothetical protein
MSERVTLKPGVEVVASGRRFRIQQVLDLETVLARDIASGEVRPLKVCDLTPMLTPRSNTLPVTDDPDLVTVSRYYQDLCNFAG